MKNRILQLSIYERQITKSCKKHSGGNHWKNVTFHNFGITNVKEDRADINCQYFRDTSLHKPSKKESSTSKVSSWAPCTCFWSRISFASVLWLAAPCSKEESDFWRLRSWSASFGGVLFRICSLQRLFELWKVDVIKELFYMYLTVQLIVNLSKSRQLQYGY